MEEMWGLTAERMQLCAGTETPGGDVNNCNGRKVEYKILVVKILLVIYMHTSNLV